MGFKLTSKDYADYLNRVTDFLATKKDYITDLDSATGDGDHWANMNQGFQKLKEKHDILASQSIPKMLLDTGMTLMSTIGGSSGVLYGSGYMSASKALNEAEYIDIDNLYVLLNSMLKGIMDRGDAVPGYKTMIDALYPAVSVLKHDLDNHEDETKTLNDVKQVAVEGAEKTRDMESVKGRASYQLNKGVGHLDPGAVTMSYLIVELMDYTLERGKQV